MSERANELSESKESEEEEEEEKLHNMTKFIAAYYRVDKVPSIKWH